MKMKSLPIQTVAAALIAAIFWSFFVPLASSAEPAQYGTGKRAEREVYESVDGLVFRLSDGSGSVTTSKPKVPAATEMLSPMETERLLAGLSPLISEPEDITDFPAGADSPRPPKSADTIKSGFPADDKREMPAKNTSAPLTVVRNAPEGTIGKAKSISITFSEPMVPVGSQEAAASFTPVILEPEISGKWRWLGTRTLLFEADEPFPMATRFTAKVPAGTKSAGGKTLAKDFVWNFSTTPPKVSSFYPNSSPSRPDSLIILGFDQKVNVAEVLRYITIEALGKRIDFRAAEESEISTDPIAQRIIKSIPDGRMVAIRALGFKQTDKKAFPPDAKVVVTLRKGIPSAEGPLVTTDEQVFSFQIFGAMKFLSLQCGWSEKSICDPTESLRVVFSTPIDSQKFDPKLISIEPAIEDARIYPSGPEIIIEGRKKANTVYRITVDKAITDTLGQNPVDSVTARISTKGITPELLAGQQRMIVANPFVKPTFSFVSAGFDSLRIKVFRVEPEDWIKFLEYADKSSDDGKQAILQPPGSLISDSVVRIADGKNDYTETVIELSRFLKGGTGNLVIEVGEPKAERNGERQSAAVWVQATRIGLDAFVDNGNLIGYVTDLATGKPLSGAEVSLSAKFDGQSSVSDSSFRFNNPSGIQYELLGNLLSWNATPVLTEDSAYKVRTSDQSGSINMFRSQKAVSGTDAIVTIPLPVKGSGKAPYGVFARVGSDRAFLPSEYSIYDYQSDYDQWVQKDEKDSLRWFVFDDRGIYRPGETVSLKGYVRRTETGKASIISGIRNGSVIWTLRDSRNNEVSGGKAELNSFGAFDFEIAIPQKSNLGSWRIEFTAMNAPANLANTSFSHSFQIQEFRRPEFEVKAGNESSGPQIVGGNAIMSVAAKYYSGGALAGSAVRWTVNAMPTSYTPPNRGDFVFGKWVPWWRDSDSGFGRFAAGGTKTFEGETDAEGRHFLRIDFDSVSPPQPYLITANVSVSDVNRQTFASQTSLIVHPSEVYVGLRSPRTFVSKSAEVPVEAIAADIDGNLLSGKNIEIIAVAKDWIFQSGEWRETEIDRQSCNVQSAAAAVRCSFIARYSGRYSITARVRDDFERPNESEILIWVAGGELPRTSGLSADDVEIIPVRKEFAPGDMAEILVLSPYVNADGVLTLRRNGSVIATQHFKVTDSTATLRFPIGEESIPNIVAGVTINGFVDENTNENSPGLRRPAYARGSAEINISKAPRRLEVMAEAKEKTLMPGGSTTIDISVRDMEGKPVTDSEVTVIAVDESILSLTGFRISDPLDAFYPVSYDTVREHNLRQIIDVGLTGGVAHGSGYGMGAGEGNAKYTAMPAAAARAKDSAESNGTTISVRKDFRPLALFSPSVRTDSDGRASVAIKLPDNLTRYRITAIANDGEKRFGKYESTITARQPLMIRPSAPRFLNIGDSAELPAVIENQTDRDLAVNVAIRGANIAIGVNSDGKIASMGKRLLVRANSREEVRFPVAAKKAGTARFQLVASAENFADAAEIQIPILVPATTEDFAVYGSIAKSGAIAQPIKLPADIYRQFGGLEVSMSSTQLQELTDAFISLVDYPFECSEQIASRMISTAALRDVLTAFNAKGVPGREALDARFAKDIEILRSRMREDGSFGLWRRDNERYGYPFVSIHAAHSLVLARKKGYAVPDEMLRAAGKYLKSIESRPDRQNSKKPQTSAAILAYALYVRSELGDKDIARAKELLASVLSEEPSFEAVGWLLSVLAEDPGSRQQVDQILRFLNNRVAETASSAHFVTNYGDDGWLIMQSERRADGILLDALIKADRNSELIPKLVRGLLDSRIRGSWSGTQENVFILLALDSYFRAFEAITPEFVARVWVGDRFGGEKAFNGRSSETHLLNIPMPQLFSLSGNESYGNLLIDKQGPGRLYYRIGIRYAPLNADVRPADYGFTVLRTYDPVDNGEDVKRNEDGSWTVRSGARIRVRITLIAPANRYHIALVDRIPAGFEILNPDLAVTEALPGQRPGVGGNGRSLLWPDHQNLRDDRAEAFSAVLTGGVYEYSYVVRSTTPGRFIAPPVKVEEMYHPETFGRSGAEVVSIQ